MRLPRTHPRYYVDVALVFPLLVAGVGAWTALWPPASRDMRQFSMCGASMLICLLFMKERLFTIAALFMFVAAQSGWHFTLAKGASSERPAFEMAVISLLLSLGIALLITLVRKGARLYGDPPTRFDWAFAGTLLAAVAGCFAVMVFRTVQWWYLAAYGR